MSGRPGRLARVLRATGTVFIVLGILILYFVAYELWGTSLQARGHQRALRAEFSAMLDDPRLRRPGPAPSEPASPQLGIRGIAELVIPRIGLDKIVVEGVDLGHLEYGPGHYPDSAPIGRPGTAAIAGHRTGWGGPFYNLDAVSAGDLIILKTTGATYTYRVTRGNVVVSPSDYWVIRGDPQSRATAKLTLTTCTPRYTSRMRLAVWADLIGTESRA